MKIILAPDSFKGSLTSIQAAQAMKQGIEQALPLAECTMIPMADGGEGTMDALLYNLEGVKTDITVLDPLGRKHVSQIAITKDNKLAIIESAAIIGLPLLSSSERNPMESTSYGLGEAILFCLDRGIRQFIIGLGGSATNDGGIGLLEALGAQFFHHEKPATPLRAKHLHSLTKVKLLSLDPRLKECSLIIASDVDNPLCGQYGASAIFGPQKGATPDMIKALDEGLAHYAAMLDPTLSFAHQPGAGAAGGLGFAFLLLGGQLQPGAEIIANSLHIESLLKSSDLLITGEGKSDYQTKFGKAPFYLAQLAKKHGVPVVFISGSLGEGYEAMANHVDSFFSIIPHPTSLEQAVQHAEVWLRDTAYHVGKLLAIKELDRGTLTRQKES